MENNFCKFLFCIVISRPNESKSMQKEKQQNHLNSLYTKEERGGHLPCSLKRWFWIFLSITVSNVPHKDIKEELYRKHKVEQIRL